MYYGYTTQRLADEDKTIIKKGWFHDFDILEISKWTSSNRESKTQDPNIIIDTTKTEIRKHSHRNEPKSDVSRNTTYSNQTEYFFWDKQDFLFIDYIEKGRNIDCEYHVALLVRLKEEI